MNENNIVLQCLSSCRPTARGKLRGDCPICVLRKGSEDKRRSLSVDPHSGWWECYRCAGKGKLDNIPKAYLTQVRAPSKTAIKIKPPEHFYKLSEGPGLTSKALAPGRSYLRKRGYHEASWDLFGLGTCASGWCAQRVVIPITDGGDLVGWSARVWYDEPKPREPYRYPAGMPRSEILYNREALDISTTHPIIVVEGCFDALPHFPHAVAVLGTFGDNHLDMLLKTQRPIAVALDPDAERSGKALAYEFRRKGVDAGWIELPSGCDPGVMDRDWMVERAHDCILTGRVTG